MSDPTVLYSTPPNYEEVKKAFGLSDATVMRGIVFAYFPHIYKPNGKPLTDHVYVHEKVHLKQQERYGVEDWWYDYLLHDGFRLEQEIEAYHAQYVFMERQFKNRERLSTELHRIASNLSGPMYGNLVSLPEAKLIISTPPKM